MTEYPAPYDDEVEDIPYGWKWEDSAKMAQEMEQGRKTVKAVLRCKYQGYAFDLEAELTVDQIPQLIGRLRQVGVDAGNSPYLWDGQGNAPKAAQMPQQPHPQTASPQPTQMQAAGAGAGTEDQPHMTPNGNPICPRHGAEMAVSKFGGWYCTQKTDNPSWSNNKGYCSYQYKP